MKAASHRQNADVTYAGDSIHLEITSKCQLACVVCARTRFPDLVPKKDMDIDLMLRVTEGFEEVYICGNHGDAIYHARFHEMLGRMQNERPDARLVIETNGSGRKQEWWEETARHLRSKDVFIFNVDGVRSNNHIYRLNANWSSIEIGMRTLRQANHDVQMRWRYILMHHNQDTVREAAMLAREIGFNHFQLIGSGLYNEYEWTRPTISLDDCTNAIADVTA